MSAAKAPAARGAVGGRFPAQPHLSLKPRVASASAGVGCSRQPRHGVQAAAWQASAATGSQGRRCCARAPCPWPAAAFPPFSSTAALQQGVRADPQLDKPPQPGARVRDGALPGDRRQGGRRELAAAAAQRVLRGSCCAMGDAAAAARVRAPVAKRGEAAVTLVVVHGPGRAAARRRSKQLAAGAPLPPAARGWTHANMRCPRPLFCAPAGGRRL